VGKESVLPSGFSLLENAWELFKWLVKIADTNKTYIIHILPKEG